MGTVRTIGHGSFTITAQDGTTVTVQVDRSTTYFDPGVTSPTIASVAVGEQVAVFGTEASGSVTATRVALGIPPAGGRGGPGGGWAWPGRSPGSGPGGDPAGRPAGGPAGRDWAPASTGSPAS